MTLLRSYLYVPGTRPELYGKALASAADAVILDLEDAVAPDRKADARASVAALLREPPPKPVFVRVNAVDSGLAQEDLEALAGAPLAGIRLPKVESPEQVERAASMLDNDDAIIWCLIESAIGLERAYEIAGAHARVSGISLGEADLRASLRVPDDAGLDWARGRCVAAARAAGLASPIQAVYTAIHDLDGLRASCTRGRDLGFFGRSAIHPSQIESINDVYTPEEGEVAAARELLAAMDAANDAGTGAILLPDGRFVDLALAEEARFTVAVADRLAGAGA